ncbi:hypothetical protein TSUD_253030 [Trifolium subterraneum]|nr:hypothetical protein TSUD_253030 [Trifolium subterraneum]
MHCLACLPVTPNTQQLSQLPKSPPKQHLFPNTTIHNHISFLCKHVRIKEAIDTLSHLQDNNIGPSIYGELLQGCVYARDLNLGLQIHAHIIKKGSFFTTNEFIESKLVILYAKCGITDAAFHLFRNVVKNQNLFSWAAILGLQARTGFSKEALLSYVEMMEKGFCPDNFVVPNALKACGALKWVGFGKGAIKEGKQGHAVSVKMGFELVSKDEVTWNLMISSYVQFGMFEKALEMCSWMKEKNLRFDCVTLSSLLAVATDTRDVELGKKLHGFCIRNESDSDVVVLSGVVDMYAKCGRMDCARGVFSSAKKKDIVLWNTMLAACAENGLSGEALKLFFQMQLESVPPNVVSWNSLIFGFFRNGQVVEAQEMFSEMKSSGVMPNLITWTTVISGLAQNGLGYEANTVFRQMQDAGIKPNSISITSALSACTDMALLNYGKAIHGPHFFEGISNVT